MRTMQMLKMKSYSVKAVREQIRTTIENLPFQTPFTATKRFPESQMYIDLNHSVPNNLLRQMIQALDLSDRSAEKDRKTSDRQSERAYSNFEDAKVAFYQSLYAFLDLVGPLQPYQAYVYGVYTQAAFETENELVWTDK